MCGCGMVAAVTLILLVCYTVYVKFAIIIIIIIIIKNNNNNTRPADVLVPNWDLGKPAAFDLTVASPLNQSILNEACVTAGSSARVSKQRKHASNDVKCSELGWSCILLAVETYGCWGAEARLHFSRFASRLAARLNCSKSHATSTLYGRLNLVLVRANARALLSRAYGIGSDIPA